jgi:hypothetical protein
MDEFIDILVQQVDRWDAIERKWNPCRRFIATSVKGVPVHLSSSHIWKQSLESILVENFVVTASSQIYSLHLCLGTVEEINESDVDRNSSGEETRGAWERWETENGIPVKKEQPVQKNKKQLAGRRIKKEPVKGEVKKEPTSRTSTRKSKPAITRELLSLSTSDTAFSTVSRKRSFSHSNVKEEDVKSVDLSSDLAENKTEKESQKIEQQKETEIPEAPPAERTRHRSTRR